VVDLVSANWVLYLGFLGRGGRGRFGVSGEGHLVDLDWVGE
jgi:hypothetical protein